MLKLDNHPKKTDRIDDGPLDDTEGGDRIFTRRRLTIILAGVIVAVLIGLCASYIYTSLDYGSSRNDVLSGKKASPAAGKQAFDRQTHLFLGIIKSEGYSARRGGDVYYVERPGGQLIEVRKEMIEVRQAGK